MYQVGDKVVHPGHGGCVVEEIGKKCLGGQTRDFYTLLPMNEHNLRVMVPVKSAKDIGIRGVISSAEARVLLYSIREMDTSWVEDRKERQTRYDEIMKSDDLERIAQTVKCLIVQKLVGKITAMDQQILQKGKEKLFSELALSMGCSYDEIDRAVTNMAQ